MVQGYHFTGIVTNSAFRPAFVNGALTSRTSPWFAATANTGYVLLPLPEVEPLDTIYSNV
jgi:hypothetical protein